MNPTDFFSTAQLLLSNKQEPHLRTSISRSYYGLFLYFRTFLEKNQIKKSDNEHIHAFVRQCFNACGVSDGKIVAVNLNDLLGKRKKADYELNCSHAENDALDALRIAQETVEDFKNLNDNIKRNILKGAAIYAANNS